MKLARAICVGICSVLVAQTTFALWAPLRSATGIPIKVTYPDSARRQLYSALEAENCQFIEGFGVNSVAEMHFRGDTDAMNSMLKQLANCPGTTVSVSFSDADAPGDWRINYDANSMSFNATVNLKSKNVALDRLQIPAAKGPAYEPLPWTPDKQR